MNFFLKSNMPLVHVPVSHQRNQPIKKTVNTISKLLQ